MKAFVVSDNHDTLVGMRLAGISVLLLKILATAALVLWLAAGLLL